MGIGQATNLQTACIIEGFKLVWRYVGLRINEMHIIGRSPDNSFLDRNTPSKINTYSLLQIELCHHSSLCSKPTFNLKGV
jgi:hypothetical protein